MLRFTKADLADKNFEQFENLYKSAFPKNERRTMQSILDLLKNRSEYTLYLIEDKTTFIGFISIFTFDDFVFYEYFAISDKIRSKGYGKRILHRLIEVTHLPIVLEVELPNNHIAKKRVSFYQKIGFRFWDFEYTQPVYQKDIEEIPLRLMTYGKINLNISFSKIKKAIYQKVYGME